MIYLVTYVEYPGRQHEQKMAKRLILVEAETSLPFQRTVDLIRMLTGGNFKESSVEIIGERNWQLRQPINPAIRLYKLQ